MKGGSNNGGSSRSISSHNSHNHSIGEAKSKECDKNNPPSRRNLAIVF